MNIPRHGHSSLRRFRVSVDEASYFVTLCLRKGESGLASPCLYEHLCNISRQMETDSVWQLRAWTVMPDHLHLIFRRTSDLSFAEILRLFKGRSSVALRASGLHWQKGGVFERRLRADDPVTSVFRYVFMNPYRNGLVSTDEVWPFFYCGNTDWEWFQHELHSESPYPEWL